MIFPQDLFEKALLSDPPDPSVLHAFFQKCSGLSPEHAQVAVYQTILQLNASLFPPITKMEILLTEGCNLACRYCFEKGMRKLRRMPLRVARAAVDLLFDYSGDHQKVHITHFGGEPTLNFEVMQAVTEYAERKAASLGKSVTFGVTTNGTRLDRSMVRYFAEHNIKVLLSVDGLESSHNRFRVDKQGRGTFGQVIAGMKILKEVQPWIGARMTIMPENIPGLYDDVLGLYEMGVNQFIIADASGVTWSAEDIGFFCRQLQRLRDWYKAESRPDLRIYHFEEDTAVTSGFFGCQAGRDSISISPLGEISPCSKLLGVDNIHLLAKLGNLAYGLFHFRNRMDLVTCSQLEEACEARGIAADFRGGCFVANYEDTKDLFQPSMRGYILDRARRLSCSD